MKSSSIYCKKQVLASVSLSTLCKFIHKQGFTRQKMTRIAIERSEELRVLFKKDISVFRADILVFIDESGSDRQNCLRKFGYSLRGKPAKALQLFNRGQHITAIAAMSYKGVLEVSLVNGGVTGEDFKELLEEKLSTVLFPYNCTNPNSII